MELLQPENGQESFKWKDVTFFFKKTMTTEDKYEIDTAGRITENGKITFNAWALYPLLVKRFVIGWDGVTSQGTPVPYSYEMLMTRFPTEIGEDVIMQLGVAIGKIIGLIDDKKAVEEQKNA